MSEVSEAELTDFLKNKAVKKINIIQNKTNKYQISIILTWKEGEWHLTTTRGKFREWVSLDRLTNHMRKKYNGVLPPITLKLNTNRPEK